MWLDLKLIKQQSSLDAVLRRYGVQVKKVNADSVRGQCPLPQHTSKSSKLSFTANLARNIWVCQSDSCTAARGGKKGGNVLDFVALMERCNIREAGEKLARWFSITENAPMKSASSETDGHPQIRTPEDVVNILDNAVASLKTLVAEENKPLAFQLKGIDYCEFLEEKNIGPQTAQNFGIGLFTGKGSMSGRVVIPIHNEKGELVAYAGRSINGDEPRYKFPAGFLKSHILWNLHRLRGDIKTVCLVEGFWQCIRMEMFGYPCVALMGSSISDEQIALLSRFHRVSLFMDGDEAGRKAAPAIVEKLSKVCWTRDFVCIEGKQPDTLSDTELRFIFSGIHSTYDTISA